MDNLMPPDPSPMTLMIKQVLNVATGGLGGEIFESILLPSLRTRQREWWATLFERIDRLEVNVEDLSQRKEAITTYVLAASQAAIKTHDQEKLEALQNAVLNMLDGANQDDDLGSVLLGLVDSLQPMHLRILKAFDEGGEALSQVRQDYRDQNDLTDSVLRDLASRGLLHEPDAFRRTIANPMGVQPYFTLLWRATNLGKQLVSFISRQSNLAGDNAS